MIHLDGQERTQTEGYVTADNRWVPQRRTRPAAGKPCR